MEVSLGLSKTARERYKSLLIISVNIHPLYLYHSITPKSQKFRTLLTKFLNRLGGFQNIKSAVMTSLGPGTLVSSENRAPLLLSATCIWTSFAIVFVSARFYCRAVLVRKLWWDDYMILASVVSIMPSSIIRPYILTTSRGFHNINEYHMDYLCP
jgi:hypothetical protein